MKVLKKLCFLLLQILLLVYGCINNSDPSRAKLSYNDSTYLNLHIKDCRTPTNIILSYNSIFPPEQVSLNIALPKDTNEIIKLKITHPLTINLLKSDSYAYVFCLPKDTLEIWLDMNSFINISNNISFKGKTASISYYLTKGKVNTSLLPVSMEKATSYNKRVDQMTDKGLAGLYAFKSKTDLPDWYVKMEKINIRYSGARDKIYQYKIRNIFKYNYREVPDDLISKLEVKLDNPKAKYSLSYYSLLSNLSTMEFYQYEGNQDIAPEVLYSYVIRNIDFARKYLHSEIRDLYIAQRICLLLSKESVYKARSTNDSLFFQRVNNLMNNAISDFSDGDLLIALLAYQKDQLNI